MDFGLSPDQIELRDAVRQMARRDLASGYLERAKSTEFPWEAYRQVARLGVLGLLAGPGHNPLDREDHVAAGLTVEELAYADFNLANAVIPVLLTSSLIARSGTGQLKERWLARLVAGQTYLAFGLTEPHSGSDAALRRPDRALRGGPRGVRRAARLVRGSAVSARRAQYDPGGGAAALLRRLVAA